MRLLEAIKPLVNFYEREIQEAVAGNSQLRHPMKKTKRIRVYRRTQNIIKSPWMYYLVNLDRIVKLYYGNAKSKSVDKKQ